MPISSITPKSFVEKWRAVDQWVYALYGLTEEEIRVVEGKG